MKQITLQECADLARTDWQGKKPYKPSLALNLILQIAKNIPCGTCHMVLPDGRVETLRGSKDPDAMEAICVIRNDRFALKFLVRGILGFCEAYLDNDWDSPDTTALFMLALRNEQALTDIIHGHEWWRVIEGLLNYFQRNTKRGSRRNIARHYDLGNSFYKKWLDESMTYSSGIFDGQATASDKLQLAQENKYSQMAGLLRLQPEHHVLEIGCGWGGFAEYAARKFGCRVTGLTISQEQYNYARERIAKSGLNDKVDIRLCDYRDSDGQYDRIASIEMFEAVGEQYWQKFFETVHDRLKPGGLAAMQVITIAERHFEAYRRGADYIQKYIFPGGLLPTFNHLQACVNKACMEWQRDHHFGLDYARTLQEWRQRFDTAWPQIIPLGFDEKFRRMWEQYLCYCEAGFRAGTVNVHQFSFAKPNRQKSLL
jgi:cyclopropane-fatty-acyl-phospholipid synthase